MERYKVFLSSKAHRDLDKIYAYIADSLLEPDTALALVERIEGEILSLDTLPYRCPERKTGAYANMGYRQLFVENYTVVYRIDEQNKRIVVVTVRYSKSQF